MVTPIETASDSSQNETEGIQHGQLSSLILLIFRAVTVP